jgi:hypothetical protein
MQAEQRDGIGCALAPVETGFDRSRFLLWRSDRAGDAFGRSWAVRGHHGRRRRDRLRPLARHCAWPALGTFLPATFSAEHLKSAALSEGRAIVLWIAFVVIFHETLGWARFAPPTKEAGREDRFQLSGAEWTAEDDALLRSLIGSGKPPRTIALEMKRTVGGIRARTAKLGLRNNRLGDTSAD